MTFEYRQEWVCVEQGLNETLVLKLNEWARDGWRFKAVLSSREAEGGMWPGCRVLLERQPADSASAVTNDANRS